MALCNEQRSRMKDEKAKMALYKIPKNLGKVRVVMAVGGKFAVWNGKQGKLEFHILCNSRKQAEEVAGKINRKEHEGEIEVLR